jgi:hypothetical protein
MIGWAIVMNIIAALNTLTLLATGGAVSAAIVPAILELISVAVLVYALKRLGHRT